MTCELANNGAEELTSTKPLSVPSDLSEAIGRLQIEWGVREETLRIENRGPIWSLEDL